MLHSNYEPLPVLDLFPPSIRDKDSGNRFFDATISNKNQRMAQLRTLLAAYNIALGTSHSSISEINSWFYHNINFSSKVDKHNFVFYPHVEPIWHSIIIDLSIMIGEIVISNTTNVSWRMEDHKNAVSYQFPVLYGFRNIPVENDFSFEPSRPLFTLAIDASEDMPDNKRTTDFFNYTIDNLISEDMGTTPKVRTPPDWM